jgi:ribosome-associated toxin RatA of RatAB toxin-antitoxin module
MNKVTILTFCLFYIIPGFAQTDWELKKEDEGIKVYTRQADGSSIKAFKAEAIIEGKLSSFVAVLKDVQSYSELFTDMKEAKLIEMSDTLQIHYTVTAAPWPVNDRSGVYSNSYSQRCDHKTVTVKVKALPGYIEDEKNVVRITEAEGAWTFHPVGANMVEVTFEMHIDPGGSVPAWVINMFLVDTPMNDLKSLRKRVMLPQYQNKKYKFLVDY